MKNKVRASLVVALTLVLIGCSHGGSVPEACVGKHVSHLGLWNSPDDDLSACDGYGPAVCDKLNRLVSNNNYEIGKVVLKTSKESGKQYCFAQLHISGVLDGNSYSGVMWAMAF